MRIWLTLLWFGLCLGLMNHADDIQNDCKDIRCFRSHAVADVVSSWIWFRRYGEMALRDNFPLEALEAFQRSSELFVPGSSAEEYERIGEKYHAQHLLKDALKMFELSVNANPIWALPYRAMGVTLFHLGNRELGVKSLMIAMRLDPSARSIYYALCEALRGLNKPEKAIKIAKFGLRLFPEANDLRCRLLLLKREICDLDGIHGLQERIIQDYFSEMRGPCMTPFDTLTLGLPPLIGMKVSRKFLKERVDLRGLVTFPEFTTFPILQSSLNALRIGYTSACFSENKLGRYLLSALLAHNRKVVSPLCFALSPVYTTEGRTWRKKIADACDEFFDVSSTSDSEVAVAINKKQVHILIDADSWNDGSRPMIGAMKPSQIQLSLINFAASSAMPHIDFFLGDRISNPPEYSHHFTEKLALMRPLYQLFSQNIDLQTLSFTQNADWKRQQKSQLKLPVMQGTTIALCSNQLNRIDDIALNAWGQVMRHCPNLTLWVTAFRDSAHNNIIRHLHHNSGISPHRIVSSPPMTFNDHIKAKSVADFAFDTPSFNGHSSIADVLFAGVPAITAPGDHMAARVASSILNALNTPFLIARNVEDYVKIAAALVQKNETMSSWKRHVLLQRESSPVFQPTMWTAKFEILLKMVWDVPSSHHLIQ